VTADHRNVTVLRIDGTDELDWLLTLGAVVRTEEANLCARATFSVEHRGDPLPM